LVRQLNERSRRTLDYKTPVERFSDVLHRPVELAATSRRSTTRSVFEKNYFMTWEALKQWGDTAIQIEPLVGGVANDVWRVLVFAASNSSTSINKSLVTHAANVLKNELIPAVEITLLDLNDYEMPIYSSDREKDDGIPELAKSFYQAIGESDALLVSYAEHNGNYSVAFKNVFDWCSRINAKVFQDKPMIALSTSPGAGGASNVLKTAAGSAGFFGADLRASLSVPKFFDNFDVEKGQLSDSDLAAQLKTVLAKLV